MAVEYIVANLGTYRNCEKAGCHASGSYFYFKCQGHGVMRHIHIPIMKVKVVGKDERYMSWPNQCSR